MRFTLPAGREVAIAQLDFQWTYEGLLLGRPDDQMNQDIVKRTLERAGEFCSWLPVHLLTPAIKEDCLPPTCWIIRMTSDGLPGGHDIWSGLVVVWFAHYDHARPLVDQVKEAMQDLDWNALAKGWEP